MKKTPIEKVLEALGGNPHGRQAYLARQIGVCRQAVNQMVKSGRIPDNHCLAIERAIGGKVTAEEMRPDINWEHSRAQQKKRKAA